MGVELADMSERRRPNISSPAFERFEIEQPEPAEKVRPTVLGRMASSASAARSTMSRMYTDATNSVKAALANPGVSAPTLDPRSHAPGELQQDGLTSPIDTRASKVRANMDLASPLGEAGRSMRSGAIGVQNAASSTWGTIASKIFGKITGHNPQKMIKDGAAGAEAMGNMALASDENVQASYFMAQIRNRNAARASSAASEALEKAKADGASPEELSRLNKAKFRAMVRRVPANNNLAAHGVVARQMPMEELSEKQTQDVHDGSAVAPDQVSTLSRVGQGLRTVGERTEDVGDIASGANPTKFIDRGEDAKGLAASASSVTHEIAGATQVARPVSAAVQVKGHLLSRIGAAAKWIGSKLARQADASDLQASVESGAHRAQAIERGVKFKGAERQKPRGVVNKAKTWLYNKLFQDGSRKV